MTKNKPTVIQLKPEQFPLAKRFYKTAGYPPNVHRNDMVFAMKRDAELVGAVRLTKDRGFYLLRSMVIHPDLRRQKLGETLLQGLETTLDEEHYWCFPFVHLESFYRKVGFQISPPDSVPEYIQSRYQQYLGQGRKIIIMDRSPSAKQGR